MYEGPFALLLDKLQNSKLISISNTRILSLASFLEDRFSPRIGAMSYALAMYEPDIY